MEKHFFTGLAERIGFGVIAKRAGVTYQAVSRFAHNPVRTHKFRLRGRVLDATIEEVEVRKRALQHELTQIDSQITQLRLWRDQEFQG